jgi:hypothetical protein
MTGKPAIIFTALGIAAIVGTEVLRSFVHRRRERTQGIGGTQDIAMWGLFLSIALFIGAGICGLLWRLKH